MQQYSQYNLLFLHANLVTFRAQCRSTYNGSDYCLCLYILISLNTKMYDELFYTHDGGYQVFL